MTGQMIGMGRGDGRSLGDNAHLAQSIGDILTTPIGTRVMRRDYGSMLTDLIDQPANSVTRQLIFAASAVALSRWEPRLALRKVGISTDNRGGAVVIDIEGDRVDLPAANDRVLLSIPIRRGGAAVSAA
jgi:phage baseplate assembly protein W